MSGLAGDWFEVVSPTGRSHGLWVDDPAPQARRLDEREIAFRGSYDRVLDYFDDQLWTDGLPIVPPTIARVEQMLAHTERAPSEIIGVVGDSGTTATVWNTAVNAVMAGCRDQDLPIVLALTEMMADPTFRIRDAGSTTSWEILVILSGPDLERRGFNAEAGVMRLGRRSNTAIGRFTRLWIRIMAGIVIPPGVTDMAALGQSFYVAMAESEAETERLGWPTCRAEWGHDTGDLVLAAQGAVGVSTPIYTAGSGPEPHLRTLAAAVAGSSGHLAGIGIRTGRWQPVLAMTPAIAEVFARDGMTKDDVRHELAARALASTRLLEDGLMGLGQPGRGVDLAQQESVIPDPAQLAIVVTGNPGRNQSKYYTPSGQQGPRLTRRVESPSAPRLT